MSDYIQAVEQRRRLFHPSQEALTTQRGYSINPAGAAPHGAQIHAMELSYDSTILLTGGSDGYVRWYDLFASMNGKNMLTQNLRNTFVEGVAKGGVLTTWWGHTYSNVGSENAAAGETLNSPVHSLACQKDALWGMSGCEAGTINLWGLRHAAGTTRHVFRKHTGPVSALALDPSEQHLVSGGWDRGVFVRTWNADWQQWDLNTGQVVRSYDGHSGQISSIVFRPLHAPSVAPPSAATELESVATDAMDEEPGAQSPLLHDLEQDLAQDLGDIASDAKEEPDEHSATDSDADAEGEDETDGEGDVDEDGDSLFGDQDDSFRDPDNGEVDVDMHAEGMDDQETKPAASSTEEHANKDAVNNTNTHKADAIGPTIALPGRKADASSEKEPSTAPSEPPKEDKKLPKPLFGSMMSAWQYDADVSRFSNDLFLTSTLSGQVMLWDRRVNSSSKQGVRALALPAGTPPWCTSVCWNHTGDKIYVGRRNETVEEWDVRMLPDTKGTDGSFDNVRLWDIDASESAGVPFKIVAGHHGGTISKMVVDPCTRFLLTSSGDRGWFASSTETLLMHEIKVL
ncbi:Transcription factor spt8 [Malassezia nana]|uniref:Transcription factor spt8 n=1 Tax=Malassezia nana TaxID=180528 RepID=A0AAF0ENW2_9BASI|nr:Transcription factor spt8 [Malassezia nana]